MNMKAAKSFSVRVGPKVFFLCALLTVILAIVKVSWVAAMPWVVVWSPLIAWAALVALIFAAWVVVISLIFLITLLAQK